MLCSECAWRKASEMIAMQSTSAKADAFCSLSCFLSTRQDISSLFRWEGSQPLEPWVWAASISTGLRLKPAWNRLATLIL